MHELSIAQSVVSTVQAAVGGRGVLAVTLRIGPLAGVVPDALTFGWDVVTAGTPLEGARLDVERVPVEIMCAGCGTTGERTASPPWRCDACDGVCAPLGDGRTLEVGSVEVEDDVAVGA
ncbi:MAG: hydrogenase maturation nickel metallochaperone HypA [Actinobacteria bacterium]|nr:hydrogenase maturation nickel metallochaperone HypA [Actinomycetota bacterium]